MAKTTMTKARGSQTESDMTSSTTLSPATSVESYANSSLQILVHKLNGKNYLEWSQSVKLVVDGWDT